MTSATLATSSRVLMNLTPPKSLPLPLNVPLPRPPAWTWALSTTGPPSLSKACCASAGDDGDDAARDGGPGGGQQFFGLIFVNLHAAPRERVQTAAGSTGATSSVIGRPGGDGREAGLSPWTAQFAWSGRLTKADRLSKLTGAAGLGSSSRPGKPSGNRRVGASRRRVGDISTTADASGQVGPMRIERRRPSTTRRAVARPRSNQGRLVMTQLIVQSESDAAERGCVLCGHPAGPVAGVHLALADGSGSVFRTSTARRPRRWRR